jgi:hypothetical protein
VWEELCLIRFVFQTQLVATISTLNHFTMNLFEEQVTHLEDWMILLSVEHLDGTEWMSTCKGSEVSLKFRCSHQDFEI